MILMLLQEKKKKDIGIIKWVERGGIVAKQHLDKLH